MILVRIQAVRIQAIAIQTVSIRIQATISRADFCEATVHQANAQKPILGRNQKRDIQIGDRPD